MRKNPFSFMELACRGLLIDLDEAILNYVDIWHLGRIADHPSLIEFLGMTDQQYARWVEKPKELAAIVAEYKREIN